MTPNRPPATAPLERSSHIGSGTVRAAAMLGTLALAGALVACGGGGGDAPVAAAPVTASTQSVGPGGGRLTIDAATLTLPAGALGTAETVVLESPRADATSGELMRLRLAPAGRKLASPALLTIDVPAAPAAAQAFWLVDSDPVLAPSTRAGNRFSLALDSLGFGAEGRRVALAAGRARPLAEGDPTPGELSIRVLNCQGKVEILRKRLARLSTADGLAEAQVLSDALLEAAQACDTLQVQLLQQSACQQLAAAADNARLTLPTSLPELGALISRLLGASAAVELTGATCNPEPDVSALIADRTDGYLAILGGQVRRGDFGTEPGVRELQALFGIEAGCQTLGIDEQCNRLRTQIYPDLLDAMRRSAFDDCRDRGAALSVAQFLDLGSVIGRDGPFMGLARFRMADVEADLVQCTAPALTVRVFETVDGSPQALPDRDLLLQPLKGFNDYRLAGTVRPPRRGQIVLEGPVVVARCPDGSAPAADLVVRIADGAQREVARRPHDGVRFTLDRRPIDLAVADLLVAAALDPATATDVSLFVAQEGASCPSTVLAGAVVLDSPLPVFRLDVSLAPANLSTRWSGSVRANVQITASLVGSRTQADSSFNLLAVFDTTQETVNTSMTYDVTLPVPAGTDLKPGSTVSLSGALVEALSGSGRASVDSTLEVKGSTCVINRAGRSSTTLAIPTPFGSGGTLRVRNDGQLSIEVGGVRGTYVITGQGVLSGDNNGCVRPPSFSQGFGPEPVGSEFISFNSAFAETTMPEGGNTIAGSAVFGGQALLSASECSTFLREHQGRLETRLSSSEHLVSCTQRTTLSWQLVRE